jgi:hypothetical protein
MQLFPFEHLGPERHYERVGAPAVALRGRVREARDRMMEICKNLDFDTSLYTYFYRMTGKEPAADAPHVDPKSLEILIQPNRLKTPTVQHFLDIDPSILDDVGDQKLKLLRKVYPDIDFDNRENGKRAVVAG